MRRYGFSAGLALFVLAAVTRIVPPIFGRVVDAATGKPVRGVLVSLESERYLGLGPSETVVHSQSRTNEWGWFWLMPAIGWTDRWGVLIPFWKMGEPWLTINYVPDRGGPFGSAEYSVLYDQTSKRDLTKISNPAYFPLTMSYGRSQTCSQKQAWFATCVEARWWWNFAIPLTPVLETADQCAGIREPVVQGRCRQLNTYRAAFLHIDTFDDVQRGLALCDQLPNDRFRKTCRTQLDIYVANPESYGRAKPRVDAEPRVAQFFPLSIAGENRVDGDCDPATFVSGHLSCTATYGAGPYGGVLVMIEEWPGREEPPREQRDLFNRKPSYIDAASGVAARETHAEGTIRRYRGPKVIAADWVSGRLYVHLYSERRTETLSAYIDFFLHRLPSTLH